MHGENCSFASAFWQPTPGAGHAPVPRQGLQRHDLAQVGSNARGRGRRGRQSPTCRWRDRADVTQKLSPSVGAAGKTERPKPDFSSFGLTLYVVEVAGFEPTTTCTPSKCATRLRYTSNMTPLTRRPSPSTRTARPLRAGPCPDALGPAQLSAPVGTTFRARRVIVVSFGGL